MALLLSQVGAPPAADDPAFSARDTSLFAAPDETPIAELGFESAGSPEPDELPASSSVAFENPDGRIDDDTGFEWAGVSEPDELPFSASNSTVAFEHFEDARIDDEGFVFGPLEEPIADPIVTSVASTAIFEVERESRFDTDGWSNAPLADDVVTEHPAPPADPGSPTPGGPGPIYARVRAIDWNGNIGNFSPILNLQTGLATSAHIGFQAATAVVRSEFGFCGEFGFGVGGLELEFGHTMIETLGGTVLIDAEVEADWLTQSTAAELQVTVYADGEIVDQSGFLTFPCDTLAAGLPTSTTVLTGVSMPAQLGPGVHDVYFVVASVGPNDIYVAIQGAKFALLELRR